jgi:2,3-bisphosphoglycerate-independent phosphoglycerate mutase
MVPGDIAFKCNLAMMNDATGIVEHRRVDRTFDEEGPVICEHLDGACQH